MRKKIEVNRLDNFQNKQLGVPATSPEPDTEDQITRLDRRDKSVAAPVVNPEEVVPLPPFSKV